MEVVVINKKDLQHNIDTIKKYISEHSEDKVPKIIGVVKGNAYGLGLVEASNEYINQGIDMLAVSKIEEAVELRHNNIYCDILFLSSTAILEQAKIVVQNDIIPTIGSIESLKVYNEVAKQNSEKLNVHIKIETGFSRHGIRDEDLEAFIEEYKKCENIHITGIFTHFIESFSNNSNLVYKQYKQYMEVVEKLKSNINCSDAMLHICNSSAVFKYPKFYLDAVRVGSAFSGRLSSNNNQNLKKIGYLETEISEIKEIKKGNSVGYGQFYIAKEDMTLGIVQSGYTSGIGIKVENNNLRFVDILRDIKQILKKYIKKENITCTIGNKRYNIVSGIRMNNSFVDITNSDVVVGDKVIFNVPPSLIDCNIKRKYI